MHPMFNCMKCMNVNLFFLNLGFVLVVLLRYGDDSIFHVLNNQCLFPLYLGWIWVYTVSLNKSVIISKSVLDYSKENFLIGIPGRKTNPLGALVNIVCFSNQMATYCCCPIKALFTFNSIG